MIHENDAAVQEAMDLLTPPANPDLEAAVRRQRALQASVPVAPRWWRKPAALPIAAALVLGIGLATPPARSLAAQFLPVFRVQQVTPISISSGSADEIPNLSKLGDMSPSGAGQLNLRPTQVLSTAAASSAVGFNVQTPTSLPSGLSAQPSVIGVTQGQTVGFTFRADKAKAYFDSTGHPNVSLPPKFDGASLQLHIEPAVAMAYLPPGTNLATLQNLSGHSEKAAAPGAPPVNQSQGGREVVGNAPDMRAVDSLMNGAGLLVIESKSPTLDASGVSADDLKSFLLSLPLPQATKDQLNAIGDWRTTLPIPAPAGSDLHKVSVNGASGVAGSNNGQGEIVIWANGGMVYAAAAPKLNEQQLISVAASIK